VIHRRHPLLILATMAAVLVTAAIAGAWTLDLAETVEVDGSTVRLSDVTDAEVPAAAADLVVAGGGRPGAAVTVTGRAILRRLVMAGLADEVILTGSDRCRITFAGRSVDMTELTTQIRELLMNHVPESDPEAPLSWLALEVPSVDVHAAGQWELEWPDARDLQPGRNLVTVQLRDGNRCRRISVAAELHAFARAAAPVSTVPRGQIPVAEAMQWIWSDLARTGGAPVTDAQALVGMRAVRDLAPGKVVTQNDLEPEPLVQRGELVDLVVRRGGIAAVVRAECRQDGLLGETVSVINEFTGRPMVARVSGPGVVTMGR